MCHEQTVLTVEEALKTFWWVV